ncbi:MAG: hypothetical protein OXG64_09590 [Chloroflexi bacterium]|nr:hypothetical protein [Chloroflexota bacterium]
MRGLRVRVTLGLVMVLLLSTCGESKPDAQPTPTPEPRPTLTAEPQPKVTLEPTPLDALEARRWDAALRVCDALENTLLVGEPAFFLGALQFAQEEGMRKSELAEAMQRECPGPFGTLRYEPDLMAEFEKLP